MNRTLRIVLAIFLVLIAGSPIFASGTGEKGGGKKTELRLGYEFPNASDYCSAVQAGTQAWIKDSGINVSMPYGTDWTQATENETIEAMAAKGLDGIGVLPLDPAGSNALIKELTDKGIKVVEYAAQTNLPTTASFCIATDVYTAAYAACDYLIKQMGEKGNMLDVLEKMTDANTALRKKAIEDCVAKYPNVKIVQTISDMESIAAANVKIESAIAALTNLDGMICTGYDTTVATAEVLTNYYKNYPTAKKIKAIGIDTDKETLAAIKSGVLSATVAQNPYAQGYIGPALLKLMIVDGYVPAPKKYFIDSGMVFVTAANIDTFPKDISALTQKILNSLTTEYLTKAK